MYVYDHQFVPVLYNVSINELVYVLDANFVADRNWNWLCYSMDFQKVQDSVSRNYIYEHLYLCCVWAGILQGAVETRSHVLK